jgi:8-oxo-dGTP pyrophosphatase MutT (NUDIX family)
MRPGMSTDLLAALECHATRDLDAHERSSLDRIVEFVRREPACFERSTVEGHITGSAWILDHDRTHALLVHHKKLGFWLQPGGHADGESDVLAVAWREAREESGIEALEPLDRAVFDVDVHAIPARKSEPEHFHFDVRYAFIAPPGAQPVVSEESHDVRWVAKSAIGSYATDTSVMRMAAKWAP